MPYNFRGKVIHEESVYRELCSNVAKLKANGYKESIKKPSLFYRKGQHEEIYFADLRGNDMVAIWEDTSPLFYVQFPVDKIPYWQRSRLASQEFTRLKICHLSMEFDPTDYCIVSDELEVYMSNSSLGYCSWCGKDIQSDDEFCSPECEAAFDEHYAEKCQICNKIIDRSEEQIQHHLSYEKERIILVCRSCHSKIHRGKSLEAYKPKDAPQKPKYLLDM